VSEVVNWMELSEEYVLMTDFSDDGFRSNTESLEHLNAVWECKEWFRKISP